MEPAGPSQGIGLPVRPRVRLRRPGPRKHPPALLGGGRAPRPLSALGGIPPRRAGLPRFSWLPRPVRGPGGHDQGTRRSAEHGPDPAGSSAGYPACCRRIVHTRIRPSSARGTTRSGRLSSGSVFPPEHPGWKSARCSFHHSPPARTRQCSRVRWQQEGSTWTSSSTGPSVPEESSAALVLTDPGAP